MLLIKILAWGIFIFLSVWVIYIRFKTWLQLRRGVHKYPEHFKGIQWFWYRTSNKFLIINTIVSIIVFFVVIFLMYVYRKEFISWTEKQRQHKYEEGSKKLQEWKQFFGIENKE